MATIHSFPKRMVRTHPIYQQMSAPLVSGNRLPPAVRGVMVLGALCFVTAAITGIWRIALVRGFALPPIPEWWPQHGHLMVGGFLGGLIMFERILPLQIGWLAWVPYAYMLSAVCLHTGHPAVRAIHVLALAGWIVHRWMAYRTFRKYEKPLAESVAYITLSSALNVPGGLASGPVVALAALSFPASVILVERLEISLNFRRAAAKAALWMQLAWSGLWALTAWFDLVPLPWMGALTFAVAVASLRQDMSLRAKGTAGPLQAFLQRSLRVAYAWLLLASAAMMGSAYLPGAVMKDVLFHLMGLGFIFTMILAHAPLILPAALGRRPPVSAPVPLFVVFQALTLIRMVADLCVVKWVTPWMWTGWITGLLHLACFIAYVALVLRSSTKLSSPESVNA